MQAPISHVFWYSIRFASLGAGALSAAALLPGTLSASEVGAVLGVSVNVIANSVLRTHYQAGELEITPTDIARGYVDARSASRFSLRTNSRKGYVMSFDPVLDIFDAVQVSGLSTLARLGRDGGAVVQRGLYPATIDQDLSFRFYLNPRVNPGHYDWPLQLSVRALE